MTSGKSIAPTTFGLLRHGQTEWNIEKKIQGSGDSPLTEEGRQQTAEWIGILKEYRWDRILASDQGRVRETVAILNRGLNLPTTYDSRLREQNWGNWEGLTIPSIRKNYKAELARRVAMGWNFSAPGGESRHTVKERVLAALIEAAESRPGQRILVVCHQGVIKSALYHITGRDFLPGEDPLMHHNRLHIISCDGNSFSTVQLNIPRLVSP
jgi:probable phosphoglycerate mutase